MPLVTRLEAFPIFSQSLTAGLGTRLRRDGPQARTFTLTVALSILVLYRVQEYSQPI